MLYGKDSTAAYHLASFKNAIRVLYEDHSRAFLVVLSRLRTAEGETSSNSQPFLQLPIHCSGRIHDA